MLYDVMRHRTQLYLDDSQYRWLKQQAHKSGSIATVVRDLIDRERAHRPDPATDPLIGYLMEDSPADASGKSTTVQTLDEDLYG